MLISREVSQNKILVKNLADIVIAFPFSKEVPGLEMSKTRSDAKMVGILRTEGGI